jgi:hypothetical protein
MAAIRQQSGAENKFGLLASRFSVRVQVRGSARGNMCDWQSQRRLQQLRFFAVKTRNREELRRA